MIIFGDRLCLAIACMSEDGCTLYTGERCRSKTCAVAASQAAGAQSSVVPCLLCFDFLCVCFFVFNLM